MDLKPAPVTDPEGIDVLVLLGHHLHVRNFVASGWLRMLLDRGLSVAVIAPAETVSAIERLTGRPGIAHPLEPLQPTSFRRRVLHWLRLGSWVHGRRWLEYRRKLEWMRRAGIDQKIAVVFWRVAARLTNPERLAGAWLAGLRPRRTAAAIVTRLNPRLVFWPTTLSTHSDFEVIQAAVSQRRPTLMFEGSWDNLIAKGVVWPRPTRLLVWGELSKAFAIERHGFEEADVVVTGPPHFDVYCDPSQRATRFEWLRRHQLDPSRRLILFGGSTVEMKSELPLLRLISEWIEAGILPPAYVWYRPHPRANIRRPGHVKEVAAIKHVVIDPGVPDDGTPRHAWFIHPDDAKQRAEALAACDLMLSTFSTVVVEAALLGKPSILVAFGLTDGVVSQTPSRFADFAHVQYLTQSRWIRFVTNQQSLQDTLMTLMQPQGPEMARELRAFGLTIARCDDGGAGERIADQIELMLDEQSMERRP